jgi:replicative DNA helicase
VLAQRAFETLPFIIDDSSRLTVGEIASKARAMKAQLEAKGQTLDALVIDYLKFVNASNRYSGQRHYEIGEISAALKGLAKDLNVAVVLLAQLNREVEKRDDKRPQLSDLRESGDLEGDADVVLFLFREHYYLKLASAKDPSLEGRLADTEHKIELIIAKQRMGPTAPVEAYCHMGAAAIRSSSQGDWNSRERMDLR